MDVVLLTDGGQNVDNYNVSCEIYKRVYMLYKFIHIISQILNALLKLYIAAAVCVIRSYNVYTFIYV